MTWRGRYALLAFDCMLVVGIYFCTDMPSALQTQIESAPNSNCTEEEVLNGTCCSECLGLGVNKYNLLYTIYSWTSSLMILPVGFVIDRIGNRVSALMFTGTAAIGSLLFAIGSLPSIRNTSAMFPLMMCGRLLLGAGTGSSRIVRDRVIACWFPDKLALAFGIAVSTMGLGSVLTFQLTANLAQWIGLTPTLFVGVGVCSTGFVSAICLCGLDIYGSKNHMDNKVTIRQSSSSILSALRKFPGSYWFICIMIAAYYSFQLPFTANASKFIQERYGYRKTDSSYINGVIYDVSVILSPIVGLLLDRIGNRGWVSFTGALLTVPMGPLILFTDIPPLPIFIWIGTMFTFTVVALWSSIPHVIPSSSLGSANGIASCMLDLACGVTTLLIGQIMSPLDSEKEDSDQSNDDTWRNMFLLLFGYAAISAVAGLCLNTLCNTKDTPINGKAHLVRARSNIGPVGFPDQPEMQVQTDDETQTVYSVFTYDNDIVIENHSANQWRKYSKKERTASTNSDTSQSLDGKTITIENNKNKINIHSKYHVDKVNTGEDIIIEDKNEHTENQHYIDITELSIDKLSNDLDSHFWTDIRD